MNEAANISAPVEASLRCHYLYPGMLFVDSRPHLVTTVLGSCVSVCLWDSVNRTGGINHFQLPFWNGEGLPTPKYGNFAIGKLVERMQALGSEKRNLIAKLFGGASMWQSTRGLLEVGDRNVTLAKQILQEHGIPIIVADVRGSDSRKIIFNTETGEVLLRRNRSQAHVAAVPVPVR